MEELVKTFHIDIKLIIAQVVNFIIVVGVLWYFAIGPLTKKMNERAKAIEKGLDDAKKVEQNLEQTEKLKNEKLAEAHKEAQKIIEEAKKMAEDAKNQSVIKTKEEAGKIVADAKKQIAIEKDKMAKELKGEVRELVVMATTKVLQEVITEDKDRDLIKKTVKKIEI